MCISKSKLLQRNITDNFFLFNCIADSHDEIRHGGIASQTVLLGQLTASALPTTLNSACELKENKMI
jgi:hypothetical protein